MTEKQGTISDHFMSAATIYITEAPTGEAMADDHPFLVACKAVEKFMKSEAAKVNQWDKIPPSWSQIKSNIKAAYKHGININDFDTESSMRAELNEKRKAEKEEGQNNDQLEGALTDIGESISQEISQRIFAMVQV